MQRWQLMKIWKYRASQASDEVSSIIDHVNQDGGMSPASRASQCLVSDQRADHPTVFCDKRDDEGQKWRRKMFRKWPEILLKENDTRFKKNLYSSLVSCRSPCCRSADWFLLWSTSDAVWSCYLDFGWIRNIRNSVRNCCTALIQVTGQDVLRLLLALPVMVWVGGGSREREGGGCS